MNSNNPISAKNMFFIQSGPSMTRKQNYTGISRLGNQYVHEHSC